MRWVPIRGPEAAPLSSVLRSSWARHCPLGRTAVGALRSLGSSLATRIRIGVAGAIAPAIEGAVEGAIGGARSVRPMRLMSDSVLHLSDNRSAALQEAVGADTGLGWRARVARWRRVTSRRRPRSRDLNAIRVIRRIGGLIDSAASSRRSITTASRNAVNRERGSAHGVVARAGLAALRTAGLAAVLGGDLGRAGHDEGSSGWELPTRKPERPEKVRA